MNTPFRRLAAALFAALAFNAGAAVDANQASRADLETVKGIGPALSAKIVDARKTGSFRNWSELVHRVGGIGPGNAPKFSAAGLTVGGAAYDGSSAAAGEAKAAKTARTATAGNPAKPIKAAKPAAKDAGSPM